MKAITRHLTPMLLICNRRSLLLLGLCLLMPLSALSQAPPAGGTYYELVIDEYNANLLSFNLEAVQNGVATAIWNFGTAGGFVPGGNDTWNLQLPGPLPTTGAFANNGVDPIASAFNHSSTTTDPILANFFVGTGDNTQWLTAEPDGTGQYNYISWDQVVSQITIQSDVGLSSLPPLVNTPSFLANDSFANGSINLIGDTRIGGAFVASVYLSFNDFPTTNPDGVPDQGATAPLLLLSFMGLCGAATRGRTHLVK